MFQRVKKDISGILLWAILPAFYILVFFAQPALAATISVSYSTDQKLPAGTMVAIDTQSDGVVIAANNEGNNNIVGVVVDRSTAFVASGAGNGNQQVEVSSKGTAYVLVSNINGAVSRGAPVTASPLEGIGMLATQEGKIVGIAQADLSDQSVEAQFKTVTDKQGVKRRVLIGLVPVFLDVTFYQPDQSQSRFIPKALRDIGQTISGKPVSATRLWGSLIVVLAGLIVAIVLVYGAVRSSIWAIGRNPLAKKTIQGSLLRVIALAVAVLMMSVGAVYLILKG